MARYYEFGKTLQVDEGILRATLTQEDGLRCTPWGLDAAGCPPWLVKWLHDAWWALYREQRAEQAQKKDFHWCGDISKQGGSISRHLGGAWHVSQNCEGIHNISYCPFCGEKL